MGNNAYVTIGEHFRYGSSESFLRILKQVFNPTEALIAAELPAPIKIIATKLNLDEKVIEDSLRALAHRGAIISGSKGYRLPSRVIELRDMLFQNPGLDGPVLVQFADSWEQFAREQWHSDLVAEYVAKGQPIYQVIPAVAAIKDKINVDTDQDLRQLLKTKETIGIGMCPCRRQSRKCDRPLNVCFLFDKFPRAAIARGSAREVRYDEALDVVCAAEEEGLVHSIPISGTPVLCNCCNDCCIIWAPFIQQSVPIQKIWRGSAYKAVIREQECTGCQNCVERCPFGATEMVRAVGSKRLKASVIEEKCMGCGVCSLACEAGAISLEASEPRRNS